METSTPSNRKNEDVPFGTLRSARRRGRRERGAAARRAATGDLHRTFESISICFAFFLSIKTYYQKSEMRSPLSKLLEGFGINLFDVLKP